MTETRVVALQAMMCVSVAHERGAPPNDEVRSN
jgi:hypothetical protein